MKKFQPFSDRVTIRRHDEASSKAPGALSMPDSGKEKPHEGTVVAVGPGFLNNDGERSPIQCKAGDHVLFGKYAGTEVVIDGEPLLLMQENEILGCIVDTPQQNQYPEKYVG